MVRPERIYVDPDFKKKLKIESACSGQTIIEYTKSLARRMPSLMQIDEGVKPVEQKPERFRFRL